MQPKKPTRNDVMEVLTTPIAAVSIIETVPIRDQRGYFYRTFCQEDLETILQGRTICQMNLSMTEKVGTIRGMHFQYPPQAEMKLVRCIRGRVWDVALDLRLGSPTFLQWYGVELSSQNTRMLAIPEGCAHGFQVLEPNTELLYLHTAPYSPKFEGGVHHDDPAVSIQWPLPVTEVSLRDQSHPFLSADFRGVAL